MSNQAIHTQDLTKVYSSRKGKIVALNGLELDVSPGEIFGLLGPNGAGKTTLIKLLLGIVKPSRGRAQLFGVPIEDDQCRKRVGYLAENHRFPGYLTGRKVLEVYGNIGDRPVNESEILAISEKVSMRKWLDTPIQKYSKGMMQRIGLAQALLHDPDIVFLDEPTDGVDPVGRRQIRDFLSWLRDQGKTVFLNSHLLSEVERLCDRVAILKKGELAFTGTLESLTATGSTFHIRCSELPEDLELGTSEIIKNSKTEEGFYDYEFRLQHPEDLSTVIDILRSRKVDIRRLVPEEQSLEDFFIRVVTEDQLLGDRNV